MSLPTNRRLPAGLPPSPRRLGTLAALALPALAAGVLLIGAAAPAARPQALGVFPERLISPTGDFPSLAIGDVDKMAVAWLEGQFAPNASARRVQARLYQAGFARGGAFRVDRGAGVALDDPKVAMDAQGNFVVVWRQRPDAGPGAILAQLYRANGRARDGALTLSPAADEAGQPEVAMAGDGRFAVGWEVDRSGVGANAVRLTLRGADGRRLAGPLGMNTRGQTANLLGGVAAGPGGVAAGWTEVTPCPDVPIDPISAVASFDWSGAPLGGVQRLANDNPCIDGPAVLALLGSPEHGPLGVFIGRRYTVQRFSPVTGEKVGPRPTVAELPACGADDCERVAAVAGDGRGRFVLVWERQRLVGGVHSFDLFAQLFGREGRPRSVRFQVNSAPSGEPQHPAADLTANGLLEVAWRRSGVGIVGRGFLVP